MSTPADVRRVTRALPEVVESGEHLDFSVLHKGKAKGFCWTWRERIEPKKPRVANPDVLVVRVADQGMKERLLASNRAAFFTEPHYHGFPAALVRQGAIRGLSFKELLIEAWACMAPPALVDEFATRR